MAIKVIPAVAVAVAVSFSEPGFTVWETDGVSVIPQQTTEISVATSYIEPGYKIWADTQLTYEYKQAVYQSAWRDINVEAASTFPDRLVVDVISPIDLTALSFVKSLKDAPKPEDRFAFGFDTGRADSFTELDATALVVLKLLVDTQGFTDTTTFNVNKAFADTPLITEQLVRSVSKSLADTPTVTTSKVSKTLQKVFADSITFEDLVTTTLEYIRNFADSQEILDAYVAQFEPVETDLTAMADETNFATALSKQEALLLIDNMDGDLTYALIKSISLSVAPEDLLAVAFSTVKTDTTTLESAGLANTQNYCDPSYFAEDYVGENRTFS
jgi:hypothetical protein